MNHLLSFGNRKDGMQMLLVPAGSFLMGTDKRFAEVSAAEKPLHSVYLDDYLIDRTPVTNEMFLKFAKETGYKTEAEQAGEKYTWRYPGTSQWRFEDLLHHPVVCVTWNDAQAYCQWVGCRLPTEAEWEKAARGTDGRIYPWGNIRPDRSYGNIAAPGNSGATADVGMYSPKSDSPYGCTDMVGNVRQWVADWYAETYYLHSPTQNPMGPEHGIERVARGDSYSGWNMRCSYRVAFLPTIIDPGIGFRCAY